MLEVDGKVVDEPYLDPAVVTPTACGSPFSDTVVQPDHVFVMGDNRGASKDSRDGQVNIPPTATWSGRAFVIIWPFGDWKWLDAVTAGDSRQAGRRGAPSSSV